MLFNTGLISLIIPSWILITSGFVLSFILTVYGIPSVIRIASIKNLYDVPGERASHISPTPRLGGAIIFAGVILSSVLFTGLSSAHELKYIIAGMIVLFFIGIKDDIVSLVPIKKAFGQFMAALIIVVPGDIHITAFYGLTGNTTIDIIMNFIITIVILIALINSINFIDGIDGLASGVGIIASILFGVWYIQSGQISYSVICFSLTGSLIAFFYFNVFGKKRKIFLGDTGSMIIGFLLAVFVIHFLELNSDRNAFEPNMKAAPALSLAILFVPVFDTIRICIIRLYNKKSIFQGDHNHVHHKVLRLFGSHLKATLFILFINILVIILTYLFRNQSNSLLIIALIVLGIICSGLLGLSMPIDNHKHG